MNKLTASIRVHMSPEQKEALLRLAEADSRDLSEYCRVQLNRHAAMMDANTSTNQLLSPVRLVPTSAKGTQ
jgi:hypothetical protein